MFNQIVNKVCDIKKIYYIFSLLIFCFASIYFIFTTVLFRPLLSPVNYCGLNRQTADCESDLKLYYVDNLESIDDSEFNSYQDDHYDFCQVEDVDDANFNMNEKLKQIDKGIRISPYKLSFLKNEECALVCEKTYNGSDENDLEKLNRLKRRIKLNHQQFWILDAMPVSWCYPSVEGNGNRCNLGFPTGCYVNKNNVSKQTACAKNRDFVGPDSYYIFNHVDLTITYHSGVNEDWGNAFGENGGRIISIRLDPRSIAHSKEEYPSCHESLPPQLIHGKIKKDQILNISYTYSVRFKINNAIKWSSRYDYILESTSRDKLDSLIQRVLNLKLT